MKKELVIVVVFDAETTHGELGSIVDVEDFGEGSGELKMGFDVSTEKQEQRVVEHIECTTVGVDTAAHGGHLNLEFVDVDLFGGTGVDAGLGGGEEFHHVLETGVEELNCLFHDEDGGVCCFDVGARSVFGLAVVNVSHVDGDVVEHGANDLGTGECQRSSDAESTAGVHWDAACGGSA